METIIRAHIGCGDRRLPGFVNIDLGGAADLRVDVRRGLPFEHGSVHCIFSEHFIEHLTREEAVDFLGECYRVLEPGGCCRIATPDLGTIVEAYKEDSWRDAEWISRFGCSWIPNRCVMLNVSLREWEHMHVFDSEDLITAGRLAGFALSENRPIGQSRQDDLRGLEHRADSVVVEFTKEDSKRTLELPLVSILIPAFNDRFVREALESALGQSYGNLEVVLCDDQPSGAVHAAIAGLAEDPRVRYVRNPRNLGALENYQECFRLARGRYVKYLNDDDLLHPACVKTMVSYFEAYGDDLSLVASHRQRIDQDGHPLADGSSTAPLGSPAAHKLRRRFPHRRRFSADPRESSVWELLSPRPPVRERIRRAFREKIRRKQPRYDDLLFRGTDLGSLVLSRARNVVGEPSTVLFRKGDLEGVRPNIFSLHGRPHRGNVDIAMWLNLLSRGKAIYVGETLSYFRVHSGQEQRDPRNAYACLVPWYHFLRDGREMGYLENPAQYRAALESIAARLRSRLGKGVLEPEQECEIEGMAEELAAELTADSARPGHG